MFSLQTERVTSREYRSAHCPQAQAQADAGIQANSSCFVATHKSRVPCCTEVRMQTPPNCSHIKNMLTYCTAHTVPQCMRVEGQEAPQTAHPRRASPGRGDTLDSSGMGTKVTCGA